MQHTFKRPTFARFDEPVNVIGHDHPRRNVVALAVEKKQSVLKQSGDMFVAQATAAMPGVQILLGSLANFRFI